MGDLIYQLDGERDEKAKRRRAGGLGENLERGSGRVRGMGLGFGMERRVVQSVHCKREMS